jgi:uncharacterized membrane protein
MSNRNKRDNFTNQPPQRVQGQRRNFLIFLGVAAVIIGLAYFVLGRGSASANAEVRAQNGVVRIPLNQIGTEARFFTYNSNGGKQVRFFALKSSDGIYRAAADSCDVCYREKKGYQQDGDDMVCRKCNQRFPSNAVNEVSGGCNPNGLPRKIEGDSLVIATADLEARSIYF